MKSNHFFWPILGLSLLVFARPSLATDTTPSPKLRQEIIQERKELKEDIIKDKKELKEEVKNTKTELKNEIKTDRKENNKNTIRVKIEEFRKTKLKSAYNRIQAEFQKKLTHLNSIKTKIESKIAENKAAGKDMTAAENKLKEYNTAVYVADMAALDAQVKNISTADNFGSQMSQLRQAANKVRDDIQGLRKVLTETLRLVVKS